MFCVKANPQLNKESFNFNVHGKYPYFTRTTNNNGILGYVDYLDEEHKIQGETIAVGMLGMRFFYMDSDFYAGQFTKTLFPTYSFLNKNNVQYFIALLNKQSGLYKSVLVRDFEKVFYDSKLLLPVKGGKIDFDFIESYMRELEQERIRELEQYLRVTGLDTYALTPREHEILTSHASGATRLFRIGDLFDIHPTKSYGVTNITLFETQGHVPVVVNSSINNGVGGFVNLLPTEKGGIITYSDTTTADAIFYQPIDFIGYSHVQGLYPVHKNIWNERRSLYFLSAFKKIARGRFDYATKFNRQIAKELQVCLPVTQSGDIDYDYMEAYISAIEKIVIRGVVEWKNKVIEATKSVVNA